MPIRWDPNLVIETAGRLETALLDAKPHLEQAAREAGAGTEIPNLPEYMKYPLQQLQEDVKHFYQRMDRHLRELTKRIPDSPVARSKRQDGPTLF